MRLAAWLAIPLVFAAAVVSDVACGDGREAQAGCPVVAEVPAGFGKVTRLADMTPGTWFWSETHQRAYLLLTGGRYADPDTGEVYDGTGKIGWPCDVRLSIVRPHSLDLRPWAAPD